MPIISQLKITSYEKGQIVTLPNLQIDEGTKGLNVSFTKESWPEGDCISLLIGLVASSGAQIVKGPTIFTGGESLDKLGNPIVACSRGTIWNSGDIRSSWCEAEKDIEGKLLFRDIGQERTKPVYRVFDDRGVPKEQPIILHQPNLAAITFKVLQDLNTSVLIESL